MTIEMSNSMSDFALHCTDLAERLDALRKEFIATTQYEQDQIEVNDSGYYKRVSIVHDENILSAVNYLRDVAQRHQLRVNLGKSLKN